MAWPCITRACCINRFWTELDKADIAVPLVFTKYSDVADVQHLPHHPQPRQKKAAAIAIETQPHPEEREAAKAPPAAGGAAAAKDGASAASVMRQDFKAWRVRPEPSCKPRNEYQPPPAPFSNETQYQKDYKPWPIPRKNDHPWIPKPSPTAGSKLEHAAAAAAAAVAAAGESESGVEKSEIEEKIQEKESKEAARREKSAERKAAEKTEGPAEVSAEQRRGRAAADALNRQIKEVMSTSSSYRTEFKAYKDVKPVKPIKASSQYKPPGEETSLETSYSATYKGEQVKAQATDNKLLERRRIRSLYSEPGKEPAKTSMETDPRVDQTNADMHSAHAHSHAPNASRPWRASDTFSHQSSPLENSQSHAHPSLRPPLWLPRPAHLSVDPMGRETFAEGDLA